MELVDIDEVRVMKERESERDLMSVVVAAISIGPVPTGNWLALALWISSTERRTLAVLVPA